MSEKKEATDKEILFESALDESDDETTLEAEERIRIFFEIPSF
jgi:hypothetical protein